MIKTQIILYREKKINFNDDIIEEDNENKNLNNENINNNNKMDYNNNSLNNEFKRLDFNLFLLLFSLIYLI